MKVSKLRGKVSWFGGPHDKGVKPDEGLAFIYKVGDRPELFLSEQPSGTTGLARRLNPEVPYIATRWDYRETPRAELLKMLVEVSSPKTGKSCACLPADWGPHDETGRVADISPGLMDVLGIQTDDEIEIVFPYQGVQSMSEPIHPMVVDLSHWDPADDYAKVKRAGIVGVIYKATQGQSMTDSTYVAQQKAAKAAGLCWGAYHFADGTNVAGQVANFMKFASPDPDELFCLDWEDNPGGTKMTSSQVRDWVTQVEAKLNRPGECVIYGGNTIKEGLGSTADPWFGARRLWLCQYGPTPVVQKSWTTYWLWQYTDGASGPTPHTVDGIGACDINSYQHSAKTLSDEWAGHPAPAPEPGDMATVHVNLQTSGQVEVSIAINGEVVYGDGNLK